MYDWALMPILTTKANTRDEAIANFQIQLADMALDTADIDENLEQGEETEELED